METIELIKSHLGGKNVQVDFFRIEQTNLGKLLILIDGFDMRDKGGSILSNITSVVIENLNRLDNSSPIKAALTKIINEAIDSLHEYAFENQHEDNIGISVAALLLNTDEAVICNIGTNNILHVREQTIMFRTIVSPSFENKVVTDEINEENPLLKFNSSTPDKSKVLSTNNRVFDSYVIKDLKDDDLFIICSDGITNILDDIRLVEHVSKSGSLDNLLENLITMVDEIGLSNGSNHDNLTVGAVKIKKIEIGTKPEPYISNAILLE